MRYFLFLITLTTGISSSAFAQVLKGKISDALTGSPLSDVAVVITPGKAGIHSLPDGSYLLESTAGNFYLEVKHLGYYPESRRITLKGKDTLVVDFLLKAKVFEQEQVVITANKTERERTSVPVNVTIISPETIAESHESNILPVISGEVPGLFITERGVAGFGLAGGSAGKISIRGVGGSDATFPVLLLIDGQPQFMGLMGHPIPDSYVSSDIEKAEVVKGPASILYGTNAMGGAINLITRKQNKEGFSMNGRLTGGSFGTLKVNGSAGFKMRGLGILTSYQHDQTDGHRPSSGFRLNNGNVRLNFDISKAFTADASVSRSSFKAFDPGSVYSSAADFANNSHWVDIVRTNSYLSLSNRTGISEGGLKAYMMWGDHNLYDGWKSHDENSGFSLFQSLRLSRGNLINVGFDMKKYGGKGTAVSLGNKSGKYLSVKEQGAYLMVDQTFFDRLSLNGGIRWDHHSDFEDSWIPQMGATYQIKKNSALKLLISKGFRNPSIRELYLFPTANPDLKPERLWNHEITWVQGIAGNKVNIELTAYLIKGENLILLVPNQPAPPPMKNQNSGNFNHKGLEISVKYIPSGSFTLTGSYSYLHMDVPKVSAPVHQFLAGGLYRYKKLVLALHLRHYEKLYTRISPQINNTESFTLVNSKISLRISSRLDIFLSGENLLGQEYQMQYGYPMPGTTIFAGLNFQL